MRLRKGQEGMTTIGWLATVIGVIFAALLAIKVVPLYLENFSVKQVLSGLEKDGLAGMTAEQVKDSLFKRFSINNVTRVLPGDVKVVVGSGKASIDIYYEARVSVAGNIDLVAVFENVAEVPMR